MNKRSFGNLRWVCGVVMLAAVFVSVLPVLGHQGVAPASVQQQLKAVDTVPQLVVAATDVAAELAKDAGAPPPLRFAVVNSVQITPQTHGVWEAVPNGRIWRLRVSSPGATDLNFGFTTFWMPKGAMLWFLSESESYFEGPYTEEHNQDYRQLWTPVLPGSSAVIELFVPEGAQEPELALTRVNAGYRDLYHLHKGGELAKAGACEIDVTCAQGVPWANEIRSVCRISIGGSSLCTATLVMDAPGDFRPFLLTANHCGINSVNAGTVVAYWNFQAPCGSHGIGGSTAQNQTGSTFRAAKADVDFCLIELTATPSAAFNVYYAGWDRSGSVPGNGVGIHHPNGDAKCISFGNGAFSTISSCIGSGGVNTHWQVPWQNPPQGVTEPGSSGSAIFDSVSHLVLGTLSGGPSSCGAAPANLWDCYGKFSVSWASGASSADRLRDWLDPLNTGITTKPGANPSVVPANDTCGAAIPMVIGVTYGANTALATSAGDPTPGCSSGLLFGKGVWYTFTPGSDATYTVNTCGSGFDTVVGVYIGGCGSLTEIACDDDFGPDCPLSDRASVAFGGQAGVTYYILAGGYNSLSGSLQIVIDISNDACAGAIPLYMGSTFTEDTSSATSGGDPVPSCSTSGLFGKGVWFTFTAPVTGSYTVNTCASGFDSIVGVYSGACGSLTEIACDDDFGPDCGTDRASVTFAGTGGVTYHILAGGYNSLSGNLQIKIDLANDTCAGALALLPGTPLIVSSANATSTGESVPSCSTGGLFGNGVWFKYTASANEQLVVSTCGSSFDTIVSVYSGSCGSLTPIACNDDNGPICAALQASAGFNATSGNTYYIMVGGYNSGTGVIRVVVQLSNDQCPGAIPLSTGVPYSMSTLDATSTGETAACGALGGGVWFTYTPSVSGIVTLDACGSGYDTVVQAYSGTCAALTLVGCNDDGYQCSGNIYPSFTQFAGTAGTTYYILAGGFGGDRGNLTIKPNVAPPMTLQVNSIPNSGLGFLERPNDTAGLFDGNSPYNRTFASNSTVLVQAPPVDGFLVFTKWQLDGADYSTSLLTSLIMNANHTLTAVYIPTNDLCIGALPLTNATLFTMSTIAATSTGDPTPPCSSSGLFGKGVWFTYTPSAYEEVKLETCGSDFDTILQVFTGTCGALQRVPYGCDDDFGAANCSNIRRASVVFRGEGGVTYYILAGGYASLSGNLQIIATSTLINDDCTTALPLAYGVPFTISTSNATTSAESTVCRAPPFFGKGVWFSFVSPITGTVPISTCGSSFDTVIEVYTGACGGLAQVTCNDDFGPSCSGSRNASLTISATQGTSYYILAGGFSAAVGDLQIMVGTLPILDISLAGAIVNINWPSYYYPSYVLQQQLAGPGGIGSGTWQEFVPSFGPPRVLGTTNPPSFYRLITP